MNKALFIDRDGVINTDKVHVYRMEDFEFTSGIFDLCKLYSRAGYLIIIITNQAGIAKGLYTENDFNYLMEWVVGRFYSNGIIIDGVYHCPHHPDYTGECNCRKPGPGMLLQAASDYSLCMKNCMLIGDSESDIEAGRRAGIPEQNMLLMLGTPADYINRLPGL
ncbi:MAG: HAD family hydrolase [Bacteroidales bacterium]|jgi:D-glycero-D-manno-heptose 1,7-bisphosphate phosphatase|nr:HAD family hydrolase [Bacteroidales bacterium]